MNRLLCLLKTKPFIYVYAEIWFNKCDGDDHSKPLRASELFRFDCIWEVPGSTLGGQPAVLSFIVAFVDFLDK